ncbi:helix-turn-helix domain-containing protein [Chitinimonas sp.]|uniref:AraC family transcriptional regulator n=1 Tax=Chitinimonas sp. TaxID=1934313 RepID=UPI0035AFC5D3
METTLEQHTRACLHTPSQALSACMLAAVERDTRGCVLDETQRFNYYPATPMASIAWIFDGCLHQVVDADPDAPPQLGPAFPRLLFTGPQRKPTVSWSPGPVHALLVGFYPDALARLLGQPIKPFVDRVLPLEAIAPPALLHACQAVFAESDTAFAELERQLTPLWHEPANRSQSLLLGDWVRSLLTRSTHSGAGNSLRQLQRRVQDWTGQSHRDLQLFVRTEEAALRIAAAPDHPRNDFATVAADAGFADQSHLGREVRRVTGLPPARLRTLIAEHEAFWYYRLVMGEMRRA